MVSKDLLSENLKTEFELGYFLRLFLSGFLATLAMTIVMGPLARASGLPPFELAPIIASFLLPGIQVDSLWRLGIAEHFINGSIIFPLVYHFTAHEKLTLFTPFNAVKGVLFGLALWFLFQILFMPVAGFGFFSLNTAQPVLILFVTFNAHLIYGLLLGLLGPEKIKKAMVLDDYRIFGRDAA